MSAIAWRWLANDRHQLGAVGLSCGGGQDLMSTRETGDDSHSGSDDVALIRSPGFWVIVRYAILFGVVLGFGSLAFLGLVSRGTNLWFTLPDNPGWLGGSPWWVAVTAGAGLLVGLVRRVFRLPDKLAGTVANIRDARVDTATVPGAVAASVVSLAGGASLGPEAALGMLGGGLGSWASERRKLPGDLQATNTLNGMSAAYGGLLSAPYLAILLIVEIGRPNAQRLADVIVGGLLAATISFAVYFPIAGSTFVGIYAVPPFEYQDWMLLAAIPLGLAAGALALITVVAIGVMTRVTAPLARFTVLRPVIGGIAFGLIGVALPLTLFTGTDQLRTVIDDGAALGAGLLIAVVFAKIVAFAVSDATGFIGGPFLPMLFIGGTAGIAVHLLFPGLPEGLAFSTMFAALPAAIIAAPLTLILLAALTTQLGTLQTAPVAVAVLTAYLLVSGSGVLVSLARRRAQPAPPTSPTTKE